ncbi:MAG TPA: DNA recombination/repair protein RecA, partial [Blastocatellia bacterium]|nr:DNA recombination/repair protein RecA [Blastocatellia bacterium]
ERLGQGRDNAKNTLRDNPAMRDKIEAEVRAALGIGKPQAQAAAAPVGAEAAPAPAGRRAAESAPASASTPTGRRAAKTAVEE